MDDSTGFGRVLSMLEVWNKDMEHNNVHRMKYAIQRTQDYCSTIIIHSTIAKWLQNQQSIYSDQIEGIIRCIELLLFITLSLDQSAHDYYTKLNTSANRRFTSWIDSYEYKKWQIKSDEIFQFDSIRQYYYQLSVVKIIPDWLEGVQS
jgi:hypothetical protein